MSKTPASVCIGRLCITESVISLVRNGVVDILNLLERHVACDWGNVSEARKEFNDEDVDGRGQVVSRYEVTPTVSIVILTIESCRITRCMQLGEFLDDDIL